MYVIYSGFIYISLPFLNFNWLITYQITKKIQGIIRTCISNEQYKSELVERKRGMYSKKEDMNIGLSLGKAYLGPHFVQFSHQCFFSLP